MLGAMWSRYFVEHPALQVVGGLCGAAVVYLLMAIMWTFIFSALETLHPGSFKIPENQDILISRNFLYYSFVTLTTLGYGDITPVTSLARSLCVLEAVIGQLYLVVQVAWLVGVHVSQSMLKNSD
jgi:hypothetical protein